MNTTNAMRAYSLPASDGFFLTGPRRINEEAAYFPAETNLSSDKWPMAADLCR